MSRTVSIHLVERVDHTRILDVEDLRELAFGDSIAKHHDFVRQPIFMSPLPKTKTFDHELGETIYHLLSTLLQAEGSGPGGEFPIDASHNGDNSGGTISAARGRVGDIQSHHHRIIIDECETVRIKFPASSTCLAAEFQSQIPNQSKVVARQLDSPGRSFSSGGKAG